MDYFAPTTLAGLEVKNHFLRAATAEAKATEEGYPTDVVGKMYEALAPEVGLIISSYTTVSTDDHPAKSQLCLATDEAIPHFQRIVERTHDAGGKLVLQLVQGSSISQVDRAHVPMSPSGVTDLYSGRPSKEMSLEDIATIKKRFVAAAKRAEAAGADGVELHAAHGYLLSQFLSILYNKRTDAYGGDAENRARIIVEILEEIRRECPELALLVKMNATEGIPGGYDLEEFVAMAKAIAPHADAIEVSGGDWALFDEEGGPFYLKEAKALVEAVSCDVILTGGIRKKKDLTAAEAAGISFLGLSRPLLKTPTYLETLRH